MLPWSFVNILIGSLFNKIKGAIKIIFTFNKLQHIYLITTNNTDRLIMIFFTILVLSVTLIRLKRFRIVCYSWFCFPFHGEKNFNVQNVYCC